MKTSIQQRYSRFIHDGLKSKKTTNVHQQVSKQTASISRYQSNTQEKNELLINTHKDEPQK